MPLDKRAAMVLASFLGDSLALGAHWNYDTADIARRYGRVDRLLAPDPDSYHPTKAAGDLTHYGDQALLLLESLAANGGRFDPVRFASEWRAFMGGYAGYRDGASKATLANMAAGSPPDKAGSGSDDLAGAARIAPLACAMHADLPGLVVAARGQTGVTHTAPGVLDAAEFFARAAVLALAHGDAVEAMRAASTQGTYAVDVAGMVADGLAAAQDDTVTAIGRLGQSCHLPGAFRAVVQCVARHQGSLETALVENVMAGGDSAGRGLLVGLLLGAALGPTALPEAWLAGLRARARIEDLLGRVG